MALKNSIKAGICASGLLAAGLFNVILTPLLYDSLKPTSSPWIPASVNASDFVTLAPSQEAWERIDPIFCITVSMGFDVVVLGFTMLILNTRHPEYITDRERNFPKRYFVMVGGFQALSGVMWQYSSPGERTAPYLQVILSSSVIPITFILRLVPV